MCCPKVYGFWVFWSENRYSLYPVRSGIGYGFRGDFVYLRSNPSNDDIVSFLKLEVWSEHGCGK